MEPWTRMPQILPVLAERSAHFFRFFSNSMPLVDFLRAVMVVLAVLSSCLIAFLEDFVSLLSQP